MAETFQRAQAALVTTGTDVYGVPAGTDNRAVVLSVLVANVDGTNAASVTCKVKDSGGNVIAGSTIANTISISADGSLELIPNKLILKDGQKLHLIASADGDLEATVSVLEIT